jgi:hypothetical protein
VLGFLIGLKNGVFVEEDRVVQLLAKKLIAIDRLHHHLLLVRPPHISSRHMPSGFRVSGYRIESAIMCATQSQDVSFT